MEHAKQGLEEILEIDRTTHLRRRVFKVDKRQCRVRFEDETEEYVTIVVERNTVNPNDLCEKG